MALVLEEFLPFRLNRLAEAVSLEIRPVYRDRYGLNRPEWRVLAALAEIGPATATQLGAHSTQHKTKVSRAIVALEKRRWLLRETNPADRRFEILHLTSAGREAYADLAQPLLDREATILQRLDPEDRDALDQALAALERALSPPTGN